MAKSKWIPPFCIIFYDASSNMFAEKMHIRSEREAMNTAKVKVLQEYYRYNRELYAVISHDDTGFEPVTIKLEQLIPSKNE